MRPPRWLLKRIPLYRRLQAERKLAAAHFPWLASLKETQDELADLVPGPYYKDSRTGTYPSGIPFSFPPYRDAEVYYWTNVPRWIWEDARRRKVDRSLDVGCSYGTLSLYTHKVTQASIFLVDFIPDYMSPAVLRRYPFQFRVCNVELDALPFEGPFDQIIFTEILEHLNFHPVPTLRKLARLLSDEGRIYISTPDAASSWGRVTAHYNDYRDMPPPERTGKAVIDGHIYQYSQAEVFDILTEAGLSVERWDYAPGYLTMNNSHLNFACRRADRPAAV